MSVTIFKELTTEAAISEIEASASEYDGMYVDMNIDKERKFVKGKAALINGILKKLERARIDISADYKAKVELEAKSIKERLETANKPFTNLIEAHKKERAEILAKEKAKQEAIELAAKIEEDHEIAIALDKVRDIEIKEQEQARIEREQQMIKEATEQAERDKIEAQERAEEAEKNRILAEQQAARDAKLAKEREEQAEIKRLEDIKKAQEQARQAEIKRQQLEKEKIEAEKAKLEANKKHVGKIRGQIKEHLMSQCRLDEEVAKKVVLSLLKTDLVTINY